MRGTEQVDVEIAAHVISISKTDELQIRASSKLIVCSNTVELDHLYNVFPSRKHEDVATASQHDAAIIFSWSSTTTVLEPFGHTQDEL